MDPFLSSKSHSEGMKQLIYAATRRITRDAIQGTSEPHFSKGREHYSFLQTDRKDRKPNLYKTS